MPVIRGYKRFLCLCKQVRALLIHSHICNLIQCSNNTLHTAHTHIHFLRAENNISMVKLTCSILISNGPDAWHSGHDPGFTSSSWPWTNGPSTKPHLRQLYLTKLSCGNIPVVLVTTPEVLTNWFRCSCLKNRVQIYSRPYPNPSKL